MEETIKTVREKLGQIRDIVWIMEDVINRVTEKIVFDSVQLEFSQVDKQKLLAWYQTRKAQLQALVEELP